MSDEKKSTAMLSISLGSVFHITVEPNRRSILFRVRRLMPNNCGMEKAGIEIASPQPVHSSLLK